MLSYINFVLLSEAKAKKEASAKNAADSMGKLHELLVAKHLNGGTFPEHHRDERGLKPINAHDMHGAALFGKEYQGSFYNHRDYKKMDADAKAAADGIRAHLMQKHGIKDVSRVAWTSQKSDHKLETGVDDPNSKADLIVTSAHPEHNGQKIGVSLKVGKTKTPNYANPGVATFENWTGVPLKHHLAGHAEVLKQHGNLNHEDFKAMAASPNKKHQATVAAIKASSDRMNANMASDMRQGLSKKSHKELAGLIKTSTAPQTHLPEIVAHTSYNRDGTSTHDVHAHEEHINDYISQFKDLHVKPVGKGTSVVIHGTHKKTGKVMQVWRTTVYAGSRPENRSPRGSTVLPSENKVKGL